MPLAPHFAPNFQSRAPPPQTAGRGGGRLRLLRAGDGVRVQAVLRASAAVHHFRLAIWTKGAMVRVVLQVREHVELRVVGEGARRAPDLDARDLQAVARVPRPVGAVGELQEPRGEAAAHVGRETADRRDPGGERGVPRAAPGVGREERSARAREVRHLLLRHAGAPLRVHFEKMGTKGSGN